MTPDVMRATTSPPARHSSTFNPTLAVAVSSVIVVFFVVGFASGVFKRYIVREGETANFPDIPRRRTNRPTRPRDVGLDPEVVSALPLVTYAEFMQMWKDAEDCVVCLALFEESDSLTLLPQCTHAFHTECIDEWFKSHSTCPLCRESVKNFKAKDGRTEDQDAEGNGGTRRVADSDVVEVVIRSESSGAADASVGLSQGTTRL